MFQKPRSKPARYVWFPSQPWRVRLGACIGALKEGSLLLVCIADRNGWKWLPANEVISESEAWRWVNRNHRTLPIKAKP